jgi:hypothetical protein
LPLFAGVPPLRIDSAPMRIETPMPSAPDDVLAYAREVYAACATVGSNDATARHLKLLLDQVAGGTDVASSDLLQAAQDAQRAAVRWADR